MWNIFVLVCIECVHKGVDGARHRWARQIRVQLANGCRLSGWSSAPMWPKQIVRAHKWLAFRVVVNANPRWPRVDRLRSRAFTTY